MKKKLRTIIFSILLSLFFFSGCDKDPARTELSLRVSFASCKIDRKYVEVRDSIPGGIHKGDIGAILFPEFEKPFLGMNFHFPLWHNDSDDYYQIVFIPIQPFEEGNQKFENANYNIDYTNEEPYPCHNHRWMTNKPHEIIVTKIDKEEQYIEGTFYATVKGCDTHIIEEGIFKVYYDIKE